MMSHAAALPTQVLMPSTVCRKCWTFMRGSQLAAGRFGRDKAPLRQCPPVALTSSNSASDLLRDRVLSEIMIERYAAADDGVLFPPRRALREGELRFENLLKERVLCRLLLHDIVVNLELPFQNRIGRLVEFDVVL